MSPPQGIGVGVQPQITPKPVLNVSPIAISSPPVLDLGPTLPLDEGQVKMSHGDPLQALFADWGKTDSPYDLDGDGIVGVKDMLELLKQMAEAPIHHKDPLQALFDDWGKTDSPYDLNGDGTVGVQDMLLLLANMAKDPIADPDTLHDPRPRDPDTSAGGIPSQADRLQALLDDWGKSGSKFDLDGDGTVGVSDMLALLKLMAEEGAQPSAGDPGIQTPGTPGNQTRLQQLFADWGKADSQFDLDGDGTVGVRDMLILLARMARHPQNQPMPSQAFDPKSNGPEHFNRIRNDAAHYLRAAAQNYARSILPQLASLDPNDIRESVEDSKIPAEQKRFVLDQIAAWHPQGHKVSVVG